MIISTEECMCKWTRVLLMLSLAQIRFLNVVVIKRMNYILYVNDAREYSVILHDHDSININLTYGLNVLTIYMFVQVREFLKFSATKKIEAKSYSTKSSAECNEFQFIPVTFHRFIVRALSALLCVVESCWVFRSSKRKNEFLPLNHHKSAVKCNKMFCNSNFSHFSHWSEFIWRNFSFPQLSTRDFCPSPQWSSGETRHHHIYWYLLLVE